LRRTKWEAKDIAKQRIRILFEMADSMFHVKPELAHRYVELARRIAMRCRVRIPRYLRRRFCHKCGKFLRPGVNARIRLAKRRSPHVVITCFECGKITRIPYHVKKRAKSRAHKP